MSLSVQLAHGGQYCSVDGSTSIKLGAAGGRSPAMSRVAQMRRSEIMAAGAHVCHEERPKNPLDFEPNGFTS